MIWTVSTVKDTLANIERFVVRNLAGGADHVVVFVDDDDAEALDYLANHRHATGVAALSWWGQSRPAALNSRQRIAANTVRAIAAGLGDVDWLFHLDGDEALQVNTDRISALGREVRAVRLEVLESVAEWDPQPAHANLFKRKLTKKQLRLLAVRGLVERPRNDHYFHGHVSGKVGVRPAHDVWLGIHRAMDSQREVIDAFEAPWLRMLHYESASGADFVRKWRNLLESGTHANIRTTRTQIADAIQAELAAQTTDAQGLKRVFEQTTADDVETLRLFGFLEEIDPLKSNHAPVAYANQDALLHQLHGLIPEDKRVFEPERDEAEVREVLRRAAA